MSHSYTFSSTGVLDRPRQGGSDRAPTTIPTRTDRVVVVPPADPSTEVGVDRSFRTPGLVVLATIAIFEGYRWLGIIPAGRTGLSVVVSNRAVIVPLAVFLALTGHALTRQRKTMRRRPCGAAVTCAGVFVMAAAATFVTIGGRLPLHVLGVSYLLLAAAALGAATMGGRPRRVEAPHPGDQAVRLG